jgi:hypothetical protein
MKTILYICLTILVFGCKSTKKCVPDNQSSNSFSQTNEIIRITASVGRIEQASDSFSISNVLIKENKLFIDVTYAGGCEDHQFQLIGSSILTKSLPPIRSIQLVHNANGDNCKMNLTKRIEVDIKELSYKKEVDSKILFNLNGWKTQIIYTYE